MAAAARKDARAAEAKRRATKAAIAEARKARLTPAERAEAVQRRKRRHECEQRVLDELRRDRVRRRLDLANRRAAGRDATDDGDARAIVPTVAGRKRGADDGDCGGGKRAREGRD